MKEYTQLNLDERKKLYVMKKEGTPVAEIAQELNRDKSSLYRELARNTADPMVINHHFTKNWLVIRRIPWLGIFRMRLTS